MRKHLLFTLLLALAWLMTGCGNQRQISELADQTYLYEKDGFGGAFTITLNGDGSFEYYEGGLSSIIGTGTWDWDGTTLTLSEEHGSVNHFAVEDDGLVFQEEDSSNFHYITVSDGDKFRRLMELYGAGEKRAMPAA